ncbi:MAG: hypothetical protein COA50_10320 [Flavobacteriaceae bacterium]|nr:MAG: hypothetical protein COA50_10320 [Flavobacteriaceae bacterium]
MPEKFSPFKNIGLCFSGGGYRATFYSLGIVSYLNHVQFKGKPLLENVTALSSVSGGTLLAVAYAKAAQDLKHDFNTFYMEFYNTFDPKNDKLLETAIEKLEDDEVWKTNSYKTRSLINAFALTYMEMPVFKGAFSIFENPTSKHLKLVCFNATDFSFGLTYRFQNGTGDFGNSPLSNKQVDQLKYEVELGDVIASSSCFPLGFEPLQFPDDYFKDHNAVDYVNLKSLDRFKKGVGIMDGGIADNQGIGSMMRISERVGVDLNLIVVNDVGSFKMVPWEQDNSYTKNSYSLGHFFGRIFSYFKVKPLYWIIFLIGLILVVLNSLRIFSGCEDCGWPIINTIGSILMGIGFVLTLLGAFASIGIKILKSKIARLFNKVVPEPLLDDILSFRKLDIGLIKQMLTNRISSSVLMINDIFLKQLRRLNYDLFYSKSSLNHKRLTTTVYKLNGLKTPYSGDAPNYNKDIKPEPSTLLKSVGLTASDTATTLWWDKKDVASKRMDTLIACGQFTLCYELMDYILELKKDEKDLDIDFRDIDVLYKILQKDWVKFNKDPMFMVKPN